MKKKIFIKIEIIFMLSILSIIGIITFCNFNSKNIIKQNINEIKLLIDKGSYNEAYEIINENNLVTKAGDEINKLVQEKLSKYKIDNIDILLELDEDKWNDIENFNKFIIDLNLINKDTKYNYLKELLKIQEEYQSYFNAIRWFNSNEYEQYQIYQKLESTDENSIIQTAGLLSKYSFEKYGLNSVYIKELNEETKRLSSAYKDIATALKTSNSKLLEEAKKISTDSLMTIADIQIKIILKSDEIKKAIENLPSIY